jgi:predicted DNA-binding transcriptional regulator
LNDLDSATLESELKGKTLLVYWYLLEQPTHVVGVREVQRALGFSSPSIAAHHLDKLQDLRLVQKTGTGEYVLEEEVKVGILKLFAHMGRFIVPRYLFYSILFSTMLAAYLIICVIGQVPPSFYALLFGSVGSILFWVETVRLWRAKPF